MNIDVKDLVTLDDQKKYVVAAKADYNGITYYYLVDIYDSTNIKFCFLDYNTFVESSDKVLNTKLLPLFMKSLSDNL